MGRVEDLSFAELVQELAQFEHDSGPPDLEKSLRRRSIDARLMRLLARSDAPTDERRASVRVPGDQPVKLFAGERELRGTIVDLGEGGLRVHLDAAPDDLESVEVELDVPERPVRAAARVSWKKAGGAGVDLGLRFVAQPEAHRRRMRRLVIELLRRLPAQP